MSDANDAYAENLARVNEVQDVIASDDICNAQGQVLAKKGTRIDNTMVERITRFKLLRPLEHSIVIENELTAEALAECFKVFLSMDASTDFFYQKYYNKKELLALCSTTCSNPIIRQKITVTSLLMPQVFEQAMFCAWFGYLIAKKVPNEIPDPRTIFMAAMCHDIGMIHISEEILNKQEELTVEEWRQIQVHPIVGFNILKEMEGISPSVTRAVIEHHENLDGTGYPRARSGEQLSHEGQLLNLLDSINAIYNRRCKPFNRPLSDIIPIIQISRHSRFGPMAKKMIVLLRELPPKESEPLPDTHINDIICAVKEHGAYISSGVEVAKTLASSVGFRHESIEISSIQNAIIHITMSIVQSGIINEAYMRWLDQVGEQKLKHAYKEMEEAYLMMQEIIYQINSLKKLVSLYLDKDKTSEASVVLSEKLFQLDTLPKPQLKAELNGLWLFGA